MYTYLGIHLFTLFIISYLLIGVFKSLALRIGLLDKQTKLSTPQLAKPIGAGIVFILLWMIFVFYLREQQFFDNQLLCMLLLPTLCIAIVSFCDDYWDVKAHWRLLSQFIVAGLSLYYLNGLKQIDFGIVTSTWLWFNGFLAIMALVWSTNLFNFMDGIDGMAALQGCFIFTVGGILFYLSNGYLFALISLGLAATVLGFLCWNWPSAKIYMGDVGSTCLGFLVVTFCLIAQQYYHMSVLLWFMLYELFFIDTTFTLIRRLLHKKAYHERHLTFAFQRLYQAGWSNRKILYSVIFINLIIACLTLLAYNFKSIMFYLWLSETVMLVTVYLLIERIKPMFAISK